MFVLRRIAKRFEDRPETVEALWKEAKPEIEDFMKLRIDMLQEAGWDVAGWSVMEWRRLPEQLRQDLVRVWPGFHRIVVEESNATLKRLAEEIQLRASEACGNSQ